MKKESLAVLILILFFAALPFMSAFPGSAQAETYRLTVGGGTPCDPWPPFKVLRDYWCAEVKKQVEAKTPHKIEYNFAWMSLTKITEDLEAVQKGILHVSVPLPVFEPTKLFIHSFGHYAPFGTTDLTMATKVNNEMYEKIPYLQEAYEKTFNQKWLGVFTYEDYDIFTTFPARSFEDMKGHKIGCVGPVIPWITNIGVVPVKSGFNETYTSLQTGVYDGFLAFLTGYHSYKFYEVAKNFTYLGLGCTSAGSLTVNLKMWQSLPREIKDIMIEVGRKYPFEVAKDIVARRISAKEDLQKRGIQFYTFSMEDKRKWMKLLGNMADQKAKEGDKMGLPGTKVMKQYVDAVEQAGHQWPIKWEIK
ncbi:MAG: TRAP transporter substrate-binding protein DctP [Thermodesulfobacteriota bacterium]